MPTNTVTTSRTVIYKLLNGREFTTTGGDLEIYEDGEFATLTMDINTSLHTLGYIRINIYHDASGTIFVKDSNGNDISNRLVKETKYTYPYVNNISNTTIDGTFTMTFDDNSTATLTDNETNDMVNNDFDYWYYIEGVLPIIIKPFT